MLSVGGHGRLAFMLYKYICNINVDLYGMTPFLQSWRARVLCDAASKFLNAFDNICSTILSAGSTAVTYFYVALVMLPLPSWQIVRILKLFSCW